MKKSTTAKVATTVKRARAEPQKSRRPPKFGTTMMKRYVYKAPESIDATIAQLVAKDKVSMSCVTRRALVVYASMRLGPQVLARHALDDAERDALVELAATDPVGAVRRVFRD